MLFSPNDCSAPSKIKVMILIPELTSSTDLHHYHGGPHPSFLRFCVNTSCANDVFVLIDFHATGSHSEPVIVSEMLHQEGLLY